MRCKNCDGTLRTDYLYCPACGGKVIRNRITVKNLWVDILDRYFNLDNTFIKTFVHLFTKPENVIEGYLQGQRRKYLNPISYLGIAITFSGFIVFMMTRSIGDMDFDFLDTGVQTVYQEKMMAFVLDFQALFFIFFVPLMAVAGWLCFDQKRYNFAERTTIFMYTLAHFSLFSFIPSILILAFAPHFYLSFSLIGSLTMLAYAGYVVTRISLSKGMGLVARLLLFYFFLGILYFMLSALIPIIMFLTGQLTLDDLQPMNS
ncbi:DUF3667 domain-containing protein [Flagellimonas aequoris]|uniref:DUF3667 domain-containing protein n=1 Tax=Flagellimonas aequoris TaxID=2306997 RepID=A0A418N989_9FLAO|nr:DUF3667 domain-containing protein [Allomuricauda aequoris]RIV72170.1 DUF3667 domain-containing protein [Allomuricauda aequoris]TXK03941.1 DUF3667 domain-containing protein [Allomuricauda aequoris]